MQRKLLAAAVLAAVVAVALTIGSKPASQGQERIPAPAAAPLPSQAAQNVSQAGNYLGVGSCASPACHGGPESAENNRQRGKWNSSYTVWVEKDKHAKAYSVLYSDASKKILRNLDHLDAAADAKPYGDPRCLACHSTVSKASDDNRAFVSDGIGCEACHGAARGWITEHTVRTWDKLDPATHRDTHGPVADSDGRMVNTRDMAVRAGVCVDCHIGSPGADGLPARNMDHDMIAAGHPRLTFEMSAFLANMPHHWDDRQEKGRVDYAVHTWAVGQVASTQAALRLLAARAKAAEAPTIENPSRSGPWPELSEYDCFTCHHGLAIDSYRRKSLTIDRDARKTKDKDKRRKLGRYVWGTWYLPMTRLLATEVPAGLPALQSVDRVVDLLDNPTPSPSAVRAAAGTAAQQMQAFLDGAKKSHYDAPMVDRMLLATQEQPARNWDEACGQYLLFRDAYSKDPRFEQPLAEARALLQFHDKKQDNGTLIQYNSPFDFDPGKFNSKMSDVRGLLERTPASSRSGDLNAPAGLAPAERRIHH